MAVKQPSADDVRIRSAGAGDYDQIAEVWRSAGLRISEDGRDGRNAFCRQLIQFGGCYLVAVDGERIVGVVLGTHDLRKGWINRLAVRPEYRRSGIASRLVTTCDAAIRKLGIEIVAALVEPHNTGSLRLFEDLGYPTDVPVVYFRKADRPDA